MIYDGNLQFIPSVVVSEAVCRWPPGLGSAVPLRDMVAVAG